MESQRNMYKHNHHFHNITQQILMNIECMPHAVKQKNMALKLRSIFKFAF